MLNVTHSRYKGQPFAYVSRVTTVRPSVMGALETEWWRAINTQTETAQYALGKLPPRHPVPVPYYATAYVDTGSMRVIVNPYSPWWLTLGSWSRYSWRSMFQH